MELKELCEKVVDMFDINDISQLGDALTAAVEHNDCEIYDKFVQLVDDLSIDWLQKIYQYYQADRKEKKQDYTPKTLADFVGRLAGESDIIIDMCAGSGALTIQKWNKNHELRFELYESDDKVIPFLIFNMAIRNIQCLLYHADVLQSDIWHTYEISKGEKYGIFKEIKNE